MRFISILAIAAVLPGLAQSPDGGAWQELTPPLAWAAQDPADSLYREARSALNRGSYTRAAYLFAEVYGRHPRSSYAADSYYWEAWAQYRSGTNASLEAARSALLAQQAAHPNARTRDDAVSLLARVNAQLAQRGDARAAAEVQAMAEATTRRADAVADLEKARARTESARSSLVSRTACREQRNDERVAALDALLQMDSDRAMPILEKIMARRDEASTCLRRRAVFLISQQRGSERMLLDAVRADPDAEVREQAVFWLGQAGGDRAVIALDSLLKTSADAAVQDKAIFALSQIGSAGANRALRDYAVRPGAPLKLRENAIFWLGQTGGGNNIEFLQGIYRSSTERAIKDKIVFAVSQQSGSDARAWLLSIARDTREDLEIRKRAIFWIAQSGGTGLPELFSLYDRIEERAIREQLIFAYSQRQERGAVDKLIEIARSDKDPELRKKAIFWLSQSRDPRVAVFLEEMLTKP
ncbi:MAG: HEAT repeat domain-containing protein [Gemmatimonadales bacterium]|nr:HEAT repeat domain-containing protein [Gemmatimonadales bacterium]